MERTAQNIREIDSSAVNEVLDLLGIEKHGLTQLTVRLQNQGVWVLDFQCSYAARVFFDGKSND